MLAANKSEDQLSFTDRVAAFLENVDYRLMSSPEDRETIYRLRYDAYLREGTIEPSPSRRITDKYDDLENSWIFGIYYEEELLSSIRLSVSLPGHSIIPALGVFGDHLEGPIANGTVYVDPTRFVADAEAARRYPVLPYVTLRAAFLAGGYFNADYVLATVRREHQAFYKRVLQCTPLCPPRNYPSLTKPISLMSVHYPTSSLKVAQRYPFFHSTVAERRALFSRPPRSVHAAA
ncbi:hypothetical protein GJW-30_1_01502 [Variibacter gotjawalensis]|uniref:N-acyl amino acid synthase FeeM catalytic core domain-containing protein n=1 Tax=Variibacter gotjawalensis TaxID=1333996 RepID=A0A0S3PT16_9BRAD|nr:hypothetical protein [Variibacter gotjawalensis]NIK49288.1 hypothetical protein [Variibacter gotjawalensis]RZS51139.1 hypothetical protein EV661_3613 [Variibacter gotjawalensis]BAT58974.1 hypothetical protein GJW-30_1_01502 [Variibacter gotjawalensis]